ncbi:MAG: hypothetical protein IKJ77_06940 [Firmicutes bacterium]|nr:hypothetical protein [Bacillota bacterium]
MKKTIFVMLALVIVAACGVGIAANWVHGFGDDVTIKETVLFGDKSAAEGITIITRTKYRDDLSLRNELYWETQNTIGAAGTENTVKTQSSFKEKEPIHNNENYVYFHMENPNDGGGAWQRDGYQSVFDYYGSQFPKQMIQDIIDSTPTDGIYEGSIKLNDYVDVFPMTIYGSYMDGDYLVEIESVDDIAYFQIPIPDEAVYEVYGEKDDTGTLTTMKIQSTMHFQVRGAATAFDGNVYAALTDFYCYDENADVVVEESIPLPEGYCGLHRIPLKVTEQGNMKVYHDLNTDKSYQAKAWFRDAERIRAMEQESGVFRLMNSPDGEDLLMFSEESGRIYLTVMDPKTERIKQKLFLIEHELTEDDADYVRKYLTDDRHIILTLGNDKLCVIEKTKKEYRLIIADTLKLQDFPVELLDEYVDFAVTGENFYLTAYRQDAEKADYDRGASYYLLTYKDGALLYAGLYESSLDSVTEYEEWGGVVAVDSDAISLALPSEPSAVQR